MSRHNSYNHVIVYFNWLWGSSSADNPLRRSSFFILSLPFSFPLSFPLSETLSLSLSLSLPRSLESILSLLPFPPFPLTMSDQSSSSYSSSADKLPIKLEGATNYPTWCRYVMAAMKHHHLVGHITGKAARPDDKDKVDEWERRDEKAQSIIMLGVKETMLCHLEDSMTAQQMWDTLATQCRSADLGSHMSLVTRLLGTRMKDARSVDAHLSAMGDIRTQLANIGKPVDEEMAAMVLLLSVPKTPEWEMFLRSRTASISVTGPASKLTWATVSLPYARRRTCSSSVSQHPALQLSTRATWRTWHQPGARTGRKAGRDRTALTATGRVTLPTPAGSCTRSSARTDRVMSSSLHWSVALTIATATTAARLDTRTCVTLAVSQR